MNRDQDIQEIANTSWDIAVIGGGATGLGIALDAAARGYRVALLEKDDFAKATSSRSTKLAHGGVRYLRQGQVFFVRDALRERSTMGRLAPHIVHPLSFIIPLYHWWEKPFYGLGMKFYEALSGKQSLGPSHILSAERTAQEMPTLLSGQLAGGVSYFDGQFDDARYAISLARTAHDRGARLLNYAEVIALKKNRGKIEGLHFRDRETDREIEVNAKVVVNATGVFADSIRHLDDADAPDMITAAQGSHIVIPRKFLPSHHALMVPKTSDGRVLFAIPWHEVVIVGTTDLPVEKKVAEPRPLPQEITFIRETLERFLQTAPDDDDILSIFAGLRPLIKGGAGKKTSQLTRDHTIVVEDSGLVTIGGGKWTTYRKMAQETVDLIARQFALPAQECSTATLSLRGATDSLLPAPLDVYGSDGPAILQLESDRSQWASPLHPDLPYHCSEVIWSARHEMARTVEDVLARRTRALIVNARASREAAPIVARLLARELGRNPAWEQHQVQSYERLAQNYSPTA